jgi:hypothetical protein
MVAPTPLFYKNGVFRFRLENQRGVENAPSASDSMLVENVRIQIDPQNTNTDEWTGSLDPKAPIPGGLRMTLTFDTYLKGSGTAGVAPEIGDLFQACGWTETLVAAVPSTFASTTVVASSLLVQLSAPATTTVQAYRGSPIEFTGPNTGAALATITNYGAGRMATLDRELPSIATSSDRFSIPAHVIYGPTSDRSLHKTGTGYLYTDGILWKFFGLAGNFQLAVQSAGPGRTTWTLQGMFAGRTDTAKPSDSVFDETRPPVWRNPDSYSGSALLARKQVALRQLTFGPQNQLAMPDNPNAAEGFDPGVVTSRNLQLSIDPLMQLLAVRDTIAEMRAGSQYPFGATLGTVAGNRVALSVPAAQPTGMQPTERDRMWAEQNDYFCNGEDSGAFIAFH